MTNSSRIEEQFKLTLSFLREYASRYKELQKSRLPVKRILILASNPKDTSKLRLDEEVREIKEGLRRSKYRDHFEISSAWAVTFRDIRRVLLDFEPHIVHFAGHGRLDGLVVEDGRGIASIISSDSLSKLFELFSNQVECVILNACNSERQAEAISKHIDYTIGMYREIKDRSVIEFSVGFYDALGAGKNFDEAFRFGCNAIHVMEESDYLIPVLKKRKPLN